MGPVKCTTYCSSLREYCAVESGDSILLSRPASRGGSRDSPSVTNPQSTAKCDARHMGYVYSKVCLASPFCRIQHAPGITLDSPAVSKWQHLVFWSEDAVRLHCECWLHSVRRSVLKSTVCLPRHEGRTCAEGSHRNREYDGGTFRSFSLSRFTVAVFVPQLTCADLYYSTCTLFHNYVSIVAIPRLLPSSMAKFLPGRGWLITLLVVRRWLSVYHGVFNPISSLTRQQQPSSQEV